MREDGITFQVSDVETTRTRLPTLPAHQRLRDLGWKSPESQRMSATDVVVGPTVHPLVYAIDRAFAEHRPLRITPDAVWACLAQSLATHVDQNAEVLRERLYLTHEGQLELEERRDDFMPRDARGSQENDWAGVIEGLTKQIRARVGRRADLFIGDFSTTGPLQRIASEVALMGAMRQYFRYAVSTLCGIPEITLAGTAADWTSIRERARAFREFDLDWWIDVLDPILAKIEDTARGNVDREFWRRMYKMEHESGGDHASGWFNTFFAYVHEPPERNAFPTIDAGPFEGHKLSDFPSGRAKVPFVWRIMHQPVQMELVAGLIGVVQRPDDVLDVAWGWVVDRAKAESGWIRSPPPPDAPAPWNRTSLYPSRGLMEGKTNLESLRAESGDEGLLEVTLWNAKGIRSLSGIEHLKNLRSLNVTESDTLEDISALEGLTNLEELDLRGCPKIRDIGPILAKLTNLKSLCLMGNKQLVLEDFLPIADMEKLECVVLWDCEPVPEEIRRQVAGHELCTKARAILRSLKEPPVRDA